MKKRTSGGRVAGNVNDFPDVLVIADLLLPTCCRPALAIAPDCRRMATAWRIEQGKTLENERDSAATTHTNAKLYGIVAPPINSQKKRLIVKTFALALIATFAFAGCATVSTDRVDSIESRLSALESQVEAAANAADRAASAATRASQEASAAQSSAQRAMDAANQANERAQRISDTCCARK